MKYLSENGVRHLWTKIKDYVTTAISNHNHDTQYAAKSHTHDYAPTNHTHNELKSVVSTVTLTTGGWSASGSTFVQNITVSGYNTNTKVLRPSPTTKADMEAWGGVGLWFEDNGTTGVRVVASSKPSANISVTLEMRDKQ